MWVGDVLIDARTDEVLARVIAAEDDELRAWQSWYRGWCSEKEAFVTREGAKKFVEEKFR